MRTKKEKRKKGKFMGHLDALAAKPEVLEPAQLEEKTDSDLHM